MLGFLKKLLFNYDGNNHDWLNEIETETFVFKKGTESQAHQLLTENKLLDNLLETDISKDASKTANDWIDSDNVHIRENNDFDCTIDYFMAAQPEKKLKLKESDPAFADANDYIKTAVPTTDEMEQKLSNIKNRIANELDILMRNCTEQTGGIAYAMDVLSAINDQNKAFLLEMRDEMHLKQSINLPKEEQDLRDRCAQLADGGNLMTSKENLLKKICKEAEDIVICKREILRREYAIKFFLWLQKSLQTWAYTIRKTGSMLDYIRQDNNLELAKIIVNNPNNGVNIGPKDLKPKEFIATIDGKNILNLATPEMAKQTLAAFVAQNIGK